jgi:hypothetical protein
MVCIHPECPTHQPTDMATPRRALLRAPTTRSRSWRILRFTMAALHLVEHQLQGTRLCGILRQSRHHRRHRSSVLTQEPVPVLPCAISCTERYLFFTVIPVTTAGGKSFEKTLCGLQVSSWGIIAEPLWRSDGASFGAVWASGKDTTTFVCLVRFLFALRRTEWMFDPLNCMFKSQE